MKHFNHRVTSNVGTSFRQAGLGKDIASVFRMSQVNIADDVLKVVVSSLGQTYILAQTTGFHVKIGTSFYFSRELK